MRMVETKGFNRLLQSNEYGSVKGSFRLPSGLLNGAFSILDKETGASV